MRFRLLTIWGAVLIAAGLGFGAPSAWAEPAGPDTMLAQRLALLEQRLQLDEEQLHSVAEIQKQGFYELALIVEEFKATDSKLERLRLARSAAELRDRTRNRMAPILSPQQLAGLDALLAEEKAALLLS